MPIYEYKCPNGHITDRYAPIIDDEPKKTITCPVNECNGLVAELIPSQTGKPVLKKGIGGFYTPTRP